MRPIEFSRTFVVMQDVPFSRWDCLTSTKLPRDGMLSVGRVVYLPVEEQQLGEARIVAFADNLGIIAVSRNSLALLH